MVFEHNIFDLSKYDVQFHFKYFKMLDKAMEMEV